MDMDYAFEQVLEQLVRLGWKKKDDYRKSAYDILQGMCDVVSVMVTDIDQVYYGSVVHSPVHRNHRSWRKLRRPPKKRFYSEYGKHCALRRRRIGASSMRRLVYRLWRLLKVVLKLMKKIKWYQLAKELASLLRRSHTIRHLGNAAHQVLRQVVQRFPPHCYTIRVKGHGLLNLPHLLRYVALVASWAVQRS